LLCIGDVRKASQEKGPLALILKEAGGEGGGAMGFCFLGRKNLGQKKREEE